MLANKIIKTTNKSKEYIKIYINWHIYIREVIINNYGELECIDTYYFYLEINNLTTARKALKWAAGFKDNNNYKIELCLDVYAAGSYDNFNYSRDLNWVSDFNEELTLKESILRFPKLENRLRKEHKSLIKLANKLGITTLDNMELS
tara:strand:- start:920 stop:1360 length:441 start_codon:yes stop_codon:yes gene_type:complete